MKTLIHKSNTRGFFDYGWLKTHHSFSFSQYHNPEKMHFGALRVLNDDYIAPATGFGEHPHSNMEIVSIVLSGTLTHKDSEGNQEDITPGEVQVMSAGAGIYHSEYNYSETEIVNILQLWIYPALKNIKPVYAQKKFDYFKAKNQLNYIVTPKDENTLHLNQEAYISLSAIEPGKSINYQMHNKENGVYCFIIDGDVEIAKNQLSNRDAIGISETDNFTLNSISESKVLFIEIPMNFDK